jgi:hypothetical protein
MVTSPPLHWGLIVISSLSLLLVSALILSNGLDQASLFIGLRVSSLTTALPFLLIFAIAPLQRFWFTAKTGDWAQEHQRSLWVIAAVSHLIHLGQIGLYYKLGQSCPLWVWLLTAPLWLILIWFAAVAIFQPNWFASPARSRIFRSPGQGFPSAQAKARIYQIASWYVWLVFAAAFILSIAAQHLLFYNLPAAILFLAAALVRLLPRGLLPS